MRTGAIFARGSCRALKWMALLGVISVLGVGSAAAQPTFESARYNAAGTTVTVVMSGNVRASGDLASTVSTLFTIPGHTASATDLDATNTDDSFTITVAPAITSQTTLTYTRPSDVAAERIVAVVGGAHVRTQRVDVLSETPTLELVGNMDVKMGSAVSVVLPEAVGGLSAATLTYSLTPAGGSAGDPPVAGLTFTPATRTIAGTPTAAVGTRVQQTYTVTDGTNTSSVEFYITVIAGDPAPPLPGIGSMGRIIETKLTGVTQKTIGGAERNHVGEGDTGVELMVTAELTVAEVRALYGTTDPPKADPLMVTVQIMPGTATPWASEIDDQQDVHFPNPKTTQGIMTAELAIKVPDKPKDTDDPEDDLEAYGTLDVYILHDPDAENEVFYAEVVSSDDIDVDRSRRSSLKTDDTVIEDDETQTVEIDGEDRVFEDGKSEDYKITAKPARVDLPLEVRLDFVRDGGDTVRADRHTLSNATPTLNPDGDGTGNTMTVTLELANPDGNRMDDDYTLEASVVVYSLSSGGENTIPAAEQPIKVVDIHKLPVLTVSPAEDMVMEGGSVMVTVTLDRNPANTVRQSGEGREYTTEPVTVMLTPGDMSSAEMGDYDITPTMLSFGEWDGKVSSAVESMMVEVTAHMDDDIEMDDEDVLMIDAEVDGTKNMEYGPNTMYDMYESVSMLTIEDATDRLVWANDPDANYPIIMAAIEAAAGDDMMFTVGDPAIEIMGQALFSHATIEGMTIEYAATSNMEDVAEASEADNMLMVMAMSTMGGEAEITVTATAVLPAGGLKNLPQTEPNVAQLKFPVTVSPVVPALPLIAQLLLAALLSLGGYRRYLRR